MELRPFHLLVGLLAPAAVRAAGLNVDLTSASM